MAVQRFAGLNLHMNYTAAPVWGALLERFEDRPPLALLLLDSFGDMAGRAIEAENRLPNTEIIYRRFIENPSDKTGDNHQDFISPQQIVNLNAPFKGRRTRVAVNNEPRFGGSVQWHTDVMRAFHANGLRGSIGGYSVGTPEPDKIPLARPMLEYMARYPDEFNLDLHAYGRGLLSHEFNKGERNPEKWTVQNGGWLLGRFHDWIDYCEGAGIPMPYFVIGEYGFDVIREITDYGDVGGLPTNVDLWRGWGYPDPAEYAASQLRNAHRVFFAHIRKFLGACVFQYSTDPNNWPKHNIYHVPYLLDKLNWGFERTLPMAYVGYRTGLYTLEKAGNVRIRTNPSGAAPIVRTVSLGGEVRVTSADVTESGGYGWQAVEGGYMALHGTGVNWTLEPVIEVPPVDKAKIKQEIIDRVNLL